METFKVGDSVRVKDYLTTSHGTITRANDVSGDVRIVTHVEDVEASERRNTGHPQFVKISGDDAKMYIWSGLWLEKV